MTTGFEYKVVYFSGTERAQFVENQLTALGKKGWRLVSVTETAAADGSSCGSTAYLIRTCDGDPLTVTKR